MLLPQDPTQPAIQEAEHFVQAAIDALAAHSAILDGEGTIIGVNAAWRRYADNNGFKDPTYGIGTNYLGVCDEASRRKAPEACMVADGIRQVMAHESDEFEMEYPCHSPTERRWFVVRVSRFDWYGQMRVIVAHHNVTELKSAQFELSESKYIIQSILDNVTNAILTINHKGMIETANRTTETIFGFRANELVGQTLSVLVTDLNGSDPIRALNGRDGHEVTGQRKDGTTFPMHISMNRIRFEKKISRLRGRHYACLIRDISETKRLEDEMLENERMTMALEKERELRTMKSQFLSMMSHELRTPLSSMQLSYDMLKQYGDRTTEEEKQQYLDNIQEQIKRLTEMLHDVTTISKAETHLQDDFDAEITDLITFCRNIIEEFQLNHHKTHSILFDCEDRQIVAHLERKMMRGALTNLMSNAIKYSPEGGQVIFRLGREANRACICVTDSGIGIPEADQPYLFEPFHRAQNVGKLPGSGLGLAIVKQAIEAHGGSIDFESVPGEGTTFTLQLPLER